MRLPVLLSLIFCRLLLLNALVGEAAAAEKDPVANDPKLRSQVEALIAQLGVESFDEREAAEKKLYALGDRLLFEPELNDDADLSVLQQFHNCFILPLHAARQDKNFEIRRRANTIFGEYSFDRPIGRGASGWALYAACRLRSRIPRPLTFKEERAVLRGLRGNELDKVDERLHHRRRIHAQLERLAIRNMARDDPRGTANWVLGDQFKNRGGAPLFLVMEVWPHQDFAAALAFFLKVQKQLGYGFETKVAFPHLLEAWPKDRTIAEAAEWVRNYPAKGTVAANFPFDVVRKLAHEDIEKALDLAANLQWKEMREGMRSAVIREIAKTDLKKAEELIARIDDPDLRKAKSAILVLELLRRCEPVDESVFESFGEESADNFRSWQVQYLAEKDPVAASKLVHYPKSKIKRWNLVDDIAEHWTRINAEACLSWAQALEDEREREKAIMRIAGVLVESDLDSAKKLFQSLSDKRARHRGYQRIVTKIAETDPSEALRQCDQLFELKVKYPPISMLRVWAKKDPDAVAKFVGDHDDQLIRQILFRIVGNEWADADRRAACKWAMSIPDDEDRFAVLGALSNALLGKFREDD